MKHIFAAVFTVFAMMGSASAQKQPQGVTYDTQIIRVSDGDTIVIAARFLPAPLRPELVQPVSSHRRTAVAINITSENLQ
jgi:acetylglutamate kinase